MKSIVLRYFDYFENNNKLLHSKDDFEKSFSL